MDYELKYNKYKKKYLNLKYNKIGGNPVEKKFIGEFTPCNPTEKPNCYEFKGIVLDKNNKFLGNNFKKGYWEYENKYVNDKKNFNFTNTDNIKLNYSWKKNEDWHKINSSELNIIKNIYSPTNIDNQLVTSGFLEEIKKPIKILTWNICWQCMTNKNTGSASELALKCKMFLDKTNTSCLNNVSKFINNTKYDFIGLQEASNWEKIYESNIKDSMGCIHCKLLNKEDMVTFYNKDRFIPIFANFDNLVPMGEKGIRPYQVIFFEEKDTINKYIFINLHNAHGYSKEKLEKSINIDAHQYFKFDPKSKKFKRTLFKNLDTVLNDISNYINNNKFKVIVLGDFNDNYWNGLNINIKNRVSSNKEPPKTCCNTNRKSNTPERIIGDYILINSELKYIVDCEVPKNFEKNSDIYPTSDHLPVTATVI